MDNRRRGAIFRLYYKMSESKLLSCIRSSLIMLIPVLIIGSIALTLKSLPIEVYQQFITNFANGLLANFFTMIYTATFGALSIYVVVSVSISYIQKIASADKNMLGAIATSVISFIILSGTLSDGTINIKYWNAAGMFTAVVSALLASYLYELFHKKMKKTIILFTEGDDEFFEDTLSSLLPSALVIMIAAIFNAAVMFCSGGDTLQMIFDRYMCQMFNDLGRNLGTVLLFELLAQIMWFFGIHGNNVLEPICQELFASAMVENQALLADGMAATEIYSKTFLDVFVNMGGSGSVMCLMIAILLFSKRRSNRKLAKFAIGPGIFNISEIMIFGLPIVFNPIFFLPFILTPLVLILISSAATGLGIVPIAVNRVEWTTPIVWSGYLATGSVAGSLLQVVNLAVGILIYMPFVKMFDREMMKNSDSKMEALIAILQKSEETREPVKILTLRDDCGMVARHLAEDLEIQLINKRPIMYYQPQYSSTGECIGAEALLRWKHGSYGMIYPPLVIQVAEEADKLLALEKNIFITIMESMPNLIDIFGEDAKISINVTGTTIQSNKFEVFLGELAGKYPQYMKNIVIEITEQAALTIKEELIDRLTRIAKLGYRFAIDDFSMGSTSIKYLQTNLFTLIKLDGSMTKVIMDNERTREIVASITKLSKDLGIDVLAEFVETEAQRQTLEEIGCCLYQGYLYSPAVPMDKLDSIKK